jgi:hypothetical protein
MLSNSFPELACLVTAKLLTSLVISGRLCLPTPTLVGNVSCCLPCPSTDWTYSDGVPLSSKPIEEQTSDTIQGSNRGHR